MYILWADTMGMAPTRVVSIMPKDTRLVSGKDYNSLFNEVLIATFMRFAFNKRTVFIMKRKSDYEMIRKYFAYVVLDPSFLSDFGAWLQEPGQIWQRIGQPFGSTHGVEACMPSWLQKTQPIELKNEIPLPSPIDLDLYQLTFFNAYQKWKNIDTTGFKIQAALDEGFRYYPVPSGHVIGYLVGPTNMDQFQVQLPRSMSLFLPFQVVDRALGGPRRVAIVYPSGLTPIGTDYRRYDQLFLKIPRVTENGLVIAAPSGSGKTEALRKYPGIVGEPDELIPDETHAVLDPLRRKAAASGDWTAYRKVWVKALKKAFRKNPRLINFVHSPSDGLAVFGRVDAALIAPQPPKEERKMFQDLNTQTVRKEAKKMKIPLFLDMYASQFVDYLTQDDAGYVKLASSYLNSKKNDGVVVVPNFTVAELLGLEVRAAIIDNTIVSKYAREQIDRVESELKSRPGVLVMRGKFRRMINSRNYFVHSAMEVLGAYAAVVHIVRIGMYDDFTRLMGGRDHSRVLFRMRFGLGVMQSLNFEPEIINQAIEYTERVACLTLGGSPIDGRGVGSLDCS